MPNSRLIAFGILLVVCSSCVYGPVAEHKSPLNLLNGENYDTSPTGGSDRLVVPVAKTKERPTHIRGHLSYAENLAEIPIRFSSLGVFSDAGEKLQEASTDSDGNFLFVGTFYNGNYQIKATSRDWQGEVHFEVSDYEVSDIAVHAQRR